MKKRGPQGSSEPQVMLSRRANGQFTPGTSGNPGGRPRLAEEFQELVRGHSDEALHTLVSILRNGRALEQISAAKVILERAWGRPADAFGFLDVTPEPLVPSITINVKKSPENR